MISGLLPYALYFEGFKHQKIKTISAVHSHIYKETHLNLFYFNTLLSCFAQYILIKFYRGENNSQLTTLFKCTAKSRQLRQTFKQRESNGEGDPAGKMVCYPVSEMWFVVCIRNLATFHFIFSCFICSKDCFPLKGCFGFRSVCNCETRSTSPGKSTFDFTLRYLASCNPGSPTWTQCNCLLRTPVKPCAFPLFSVTQKIRFNPSSKPHATVLQRN